MQRAQTRSGEARIAVRWIFAVIDAGVFQRRREPRLGHRQERTDEENRRLAAGGNGRSVRDTGKPGETAAASQPKQHRLRLIVEGMGGQNMFKPGTRRRLGQEPITRETCRLLQAGFRLAAAPAQRAMGNSKTARQTPNLRGFVLGFRPQPVIDGNRKELGRALEPLPQPLSPARSHDKQRRRIAAAGYGENKPA